MKPSSWSSGIPGFSIAVCDIGASNTGNGKGALIGAWGYLPFENDDAPEGSIAIAAADITAACQDSPSGDLPENVADWVTAHGAELTAEDVELALEAVGRVPGDESELAELWDDADEPEWRESLEDLSERLRAALR